MVFDCFYMGTEYIDKTNLSFKELERFLEECETIFGCKWEPIFLSDYKISDSFLCHIVNTLYKHGYVTCLNGEMIRVKFVVIHGNVPPGFLRMDTADACGSGQTVVEYEWGTVCFCLLLFIRILGFLNSTFKFSGKL